MLLAVAAGVAGAVLAYPPGRRRLARAAGTAMDGLLLRADTPWTQDLILLTSEGAKSRYPRTAVLTGVPYDGGLHVVPWSASAAWLQNIKANPDVVIDDRRKVWRARAELIEGAAAQSVRALARERHVPAPLRGLLDASVPVVRLARR